MKLCFPIATDEGLASSIYGHFPSAPWFLIVDIEKGDTGVVANCDRDNPYAGCNPFAALKGRQLDGIVVGGIGDEAVRVMNLCGFRVYQTSTSAVTDSMELFRQGLLPEVTIKDSHLEGRCAGSGGGGCNHHH